MDSGETITVLVVDGHQTFAELLGHALAGQADLRWVGHARTGAEAIRLAAELTPDVIVLDPELSDADGIAIAELIKVRQPGSRVRSEEHTSELQSRRDLVCRLLLEKKKKK